MSAKPKIVILHPNSLCCMAMRTILVDIAPFVGMFRDVEILSYNSLEQMLEDQTEIVIHYFVAAQILQEHMPYFAPQLRRCIVLTEGDNTELPEETRTIDIRRPEQELLKSFLMMHSHAHVGMSHSTTNEESDLLSQREKDVLALIVKGYINKEIAEMLNISTPTVIFHRRNLSEKIGSKSVGRQTIYAVMNGIVTPDEL